MLLRRAITEQLYSGWHNTDQEEMESKLAVLEVSDLSEAMRWLQFERAEDEQEEAAVQQIDGCDLEGVPTGRAMQLVGEALHASMVERGS